MDGKNGDDDDGDDKDDADGGGFSQQHCSVGLNNYVTNDNLNSMHVALGNTTAYMSFICCSAPGIY